MKTPKDAFGMNLKGTGSIFCKGGADRITGPRRQLTNAQHAWMKANKPLYYTGTFEDINHIPQHLRFA